MSEQEQLSKKDELLAILQESIENLQSIPENDIEKRKTKFNTENGTGYYISTDRTHMWIVDLNKK